MLAVISEYLPFFLGSFSEGNDPYVAVGLVCLGVGEFRILPCHHICTSLLGFFFSSFYIVLVKHASLKSLPFCQPLLICISISQQILSGENKITC